jgi:Xaa-Pro aminopeptidase
MAMTVEPGIYIAANNRRVAKHWRGIGIRIEDDVVVTREGHRVLTSGIPTQAAEIERFMSATV